MPTNCGIYKIENLINGKCYFGQSEGNLHGRSESHIKSAINGKHYNRYLQDAVRKYGANNFKTSIVLYCEPFELVRYEQACVDKFNSAYNICKECVKSLKGIKWANNSKGRIKLSLINTGKKLSEETKKKMGNAKRGISLSEEHRKKLSLAKVGNKYFCGKTLSEDHKKKLRNSILGNTDWRGRKNTEEDKKKIGIGNKGKIISEETRKKLRDYNLGKKLSEETRRKISKSLLGNKRNLGHKATEEAKEKMRKFHRRIN
jgi:group I intron endonuclease